MRRIGLMSTQDLFDYSCQCVGKSFILTCHMCKVFIVYLGNDFHIYYCTKRSEFVFFDQLLYYCYISHYWITLPIIVISHYACFYAANNVFNVGYYILTFRLFQIV